MPPGRPLHAASKKPAACRGCSLEARGHGFVPPDGPTNAPILLLGESPGFDEAAMGKPFVGAAGSMLERILRRNRLTRGAFRIGNVLQCVPPGLLLEGMPYQHTAIAHCAVHRDALLNEGHPVVVAAGGTAFKTLLGLHGAHRIRVEEFHGTVHDDPEGRFQVVPTFHPSYLQRGAHNLIGTVSFDLQVALEIVQGTWQREPIDLIIDPPKEWFEAWVEQLEAAVAADPDGVAVACDMETPDKASGKPENELTPDDDSYQILRWNFACHPDQGVTVPHHPDFLPLVARVLALQCRHYWWNGYGYDWARVAAAGLPMDPLQQIDLMIAAHILQSDVPLGLGFWAPFYSRYGAWKHRSGTDPEAYACIDGPQTLRCGFGIIGDLLAQGQWRAFQEDCHELYHSALKPAQDVGILIDRPALETFHLDLAAKQLGRLEAMQPLVPEALRPLTHETGREPEAGVLHPEARTHTLRGVEKVEAPDPIKQQLYANAVRVARRVSRTVQVCLTCGAEEVHVKHRCKDESGKVDAARAPHVVPADREVQRWFWQEPFNPDSPKQMLAYIKSRGHTPGRAKKTKLESADRETLIRLSKSSKDPFYQTNLDYRAVKKVDSTYAVPTMRRVDREVAEGREGRLHPIPTFRPSTMRLCVAAGTPIEIARDVLEYPKGLPIEDVRAGMWAYTFTTERRLALRRVVSAVKTGYKKVVRVHWMAGWGRDQRRFGYVDLTPEHEVRLISGAYKPAGALRQGDRTLAMTRGVTAYGYARLWATGHKQLNEHRFIVEQTTGEVAEHIHHLNHHPLDNRPENLQGQTPHEHLKYHGRITNASLFEGRRQRMLRRWEEAPEQFADRAHPQGLNLTREWLVAALEWAEGRPTYVAKRYSIDYATLMKYIDQHGLVCSRKPRRPLQSLGENHTIVFVEPREEPVDVYDLEIEDTHNFIAGELCVHNSYVSPNITNVVQDKGGKANLAGGFRRCVVAAAGSRLLEVDYSGIEAVETGWFARDPAYIRLARLGVHAYLASHLLKRPADLGWADHDLLAYFKDLKGAAPLVYDQAKRCVHGTNYGLTPYGMATTFPELYPDEAAAKKVQQIYFEICPTLPVWHGALRQQAYDTGSLGGPGAVVQAEDNRCYKSGWKGPSPWAHPYQYRHHFWSVTQYKPITEAQRLRRQKAKKPCVEINGRWFALELGEDSKRCLPKNTKVWMGDYTYKNIQDVRPGEIVIGWVRGTGPKQQTRGGSDTEYMTRRKRFCTDGLVRAQVTETHQLMDRTVTIHFESGRTLRCTPDHLWLAQQRHEYTYRRADSFKPGDQVCRVDVSDPGECPDHLKLTAAWLGGFYDGEGSHRGVTQTVDNHGLLEQAEETFHALGFETTRQAQSRTQPAWSESCFLGWIGGRQAALKFARWIPSHRYRAQWADRMILSNRFRRLETVVKIVENPLVEPVYCLTTSTGNFVANDFCSHNCIAFYPQSTAAGVLKRSIRALFTQPDSPSYIGAAYYGRTPLRAPIHDSLLLEVPHAQWDLVCEAVFREMLRPIQEQPVPASWEMGTHLTVGIAAKAGVNWLDAQEITVPDMGVLGLDGSDAQTRFGIEAGDEEDMQELGVVA